MKKVLYSLAIIILIAAGATAVIAYGRGYRLNPWEKSIDATGIFSASSSPEGASIWIDGKLKSATNSSFSIVPGWYNVRITKEGYQAWEKKVKIQGEVVTRIDALLIPDNPSLRALTVSGISSPSLSPSGTRVAYIVPQEDATSSSTLKPKTGVWVFELKNGLLGGLIDTKQVYTPIQKVDWNNSQFLWSPDEKQIVLQTKEIKTGKVISAVEIFLDNSYTPPINVIFDLSNILKDWTDTANLKQEQSLTLLPERLSDFLKNSTTDIAFSPDNNKILYTATASASLIPIIKPPFLGGNTIAEARSVEPGKYYIYDIKEDKNFYIIDKKILKDVSKPVWYPDSNRIVMIENGSIEIIDYDGTNKRAVYSGPFTDNIVYPWTSSGKLVILTNLNKPKALPNLYEVDIR